MSGEESLRRMRAIPGFVELPEDWADRVTIGSTLIKVSGKVCGRIKRESFTVSNIGKKMLTLRSAEELATMVSRKGWSLNSYSFFYWVEIDGNE